MKKVNLNNLAVLDVTTDVNTFLLESEPPELPFDVASDLSYGDMMSSAKSSACSFDTYREIVQISMYYAGQCRNFIYCPSNTPSEVDGVSSYDTERALLAGFTDYLFSVYPETESGTPMSDVVFAGWKIYSDVWPVIVNRAFSHGIDVPRSLLTDLTARFCTIEPFLDVSTIYTQGILANLRKLPHPSEALWMWNGTERKSVRFATPGRIRDYICTDTQKAVESINLMLISMHEAVQRYYNVDKWRRNKGV